MNLQAEIQELRAMRADGEPSSPPPRADVGLMHLSAAAEAAQPMPVDKTNGPQQENENDKGGGEDQAASTQSEQTEEPRRVVQLVTTTADNASDDKPTPHSASQDADLPPGWLRVMHDSGLPCFVNEELHVVTWTKPYTLDAIGADFVALASTHVPALSIFSRRTAGARQALQLVGRRPQSSEEPPRPKPPQPSNARVEPAKKRKAEVLVAGSKPVVQVRRNGSSIPLLEVNGKCLDSPEGRTVHDFLREFVMVMWKSVPQYTFTKPEGSELPIACYVSIDGKQYPTTGGPNKPMAKEAAAEAVFEQHVPNYWIDLKKQGKVGKFPVVAQQPQAQPAPQIKEENKKPEEREPSLTMEEFKTLQVGDPKVLQACMDLSIKTPAQVVQEYQNRNRGISVNYNTVPHEVDGQKLFKTIVTAGSTVAEGVAPTKKVAKQYAAQSLLVLLHQRSVKLYHEVADLYSKGNHSELANQGPPPIQTDSASTRTSPSKKVRRSSPLHNQGATAGYGQGGPTYNRNGNGRGWEGYGGGYDGGVSGWAPRTDGGYGKKNERIVEYYSPNSGGYGGGYYGEEDWSYAARPPPPPQYSVYGPNPYPAVPPPIVYAPRPHPTDPPPGYPYPDPRDQSYNRPKY